MYDIKSAFQSCGIPAHTLLVGVVWSARMLHSILCIPADTLLVGGVWSARMLRSILCVH